MSPQNYAKQRALLVEWLNNILPDLSLPTKASDEELRVSLSDGTVLCKILTGLRPSLLNEAFFLQEGYPQNSSVLRSENVKWFLTALDEIGIPRFEASDLEKGSMKTVVNCLLSLKTQLTSSGDSLSTISNITEAGSIHGDASSLGPLPPLSGEESRKASSDLKFQCALHTPSMSGSSAFFGTNATLKTQLMSSGDSLSAISTITEDGSTHGDASFIGPLPPKSGEELGKASSDLKFQCALHTLLTSEPSAAVLHHAGHKLHEMYQLKQECYADLPAIKFSEMTELNSFDNAPTQSLLSVANGILDESVETKNGEIPHHAACLLRKVVREIERRLSTQADHLRTQNNLYTAREEKYRSRIKELEALLSGTRKDAKHVTSQLQQKKGRRKKNISLFSTSAVFNCFRPIPSQTENSKVEEKLKAEKQEMIKLLKENDKNILEIAALKQELEVARMMHKLRCLEMETETKCAKTILQMRLKELECLLADSNNKVKELEANFESKCQRWNTKEKIYQSFIDFQSGAMRELRLTSQAIKQEILKTQKRYTYEFDQLEIKLKALADAAGNYHEVLVENRKLFNELQDLKGNIRVYCRIRPFLPAQSGKLTIIEKIGENGQLVISNPSKPGKDGQRSFKFNKVFGPAATQGEVFSDIQPFVQSVVDGYNVCIFAYGQTGSGKTYTMTGPNGATEKEWGVSYHALNNLFRISQNRRSTILYEVGVQMVEIYNEQVRDLLSSDGSPKKLGITAISQPNGLAVPDASMHPVLSTSDVLDLMNIGFKNRAVGATALNARSSRSHSILTVHVRGKDLKAGTFLYGNLHLVDLAGSERVDRSEVTGDRLREAQHINKSLSSLGDVIFALAQKSPHVPYRNSKLTQVLQSSLGGRAKTLMLVQLNPDASSYSETMSTLKFAERVSGVELGAARSSREGKEGKDVRELMEQMASLKQTIAKKDEEIERLKLLKDPEKTDTPASMVNSMEQAH